MTDKIKGSCYTNLKNSPELAEVQAVEMREQEGAGSPGADRKTHRNGEALRDKWSGCIVKRLTMRYGNRGSKKGERCKPVRPRQIDVMTVSRVGVNIGRAAWSRYVEIACVNHIWGGAS